MTMEVSGWSGELMPLGRYSGVITNIEVRNGKKGPYLNIEWTSHDEDFSGRKVWRNSSFSEKAIGMPAGIAELVQATKPDIPKGTSPDALPGALATVLQSAAIDVEIDHEQRWKDGAPLFDAATGEPILRESIVAFYEAPEAFVESVANEAAGIDDELPF
jgi:hypothetical protein